MSGRVLEICSESEADVEVMEVMEPEAITHLQSLESQPILTHDDHTVAASQVVVGIGRTPTQNIAAAGMPAAAAPHATVAPTTPPRATSTATAAMGSPIVINFGTPSPSPGPHNYCRACPSRNRTRLFNTFQVFSISC